MQFVNSAVFVTGDLSVKQLCFFFFFFSKIATGWLYYLYRGSMSTLYYTDLPFLHLQYSLRHYRDSIVSADPSDQLILYLKQKNETTKY